jgi:hypothetical protein
MDDCKRVVLSMQQALARSTSLVKADLKPEIAVPGAKLAGGTYLVRK